MARPVHFEIPAENVERAKAFYEGAFGWKFTAWGDPASPYWLISTGDGPGIDGGLMQRRDPAQPCVNTMGVTNLDESIATVEKLGGTCAVPKMAIPGMGWLAYYKDTEGHIFGMMQNDPAA